MSDQPIPFIKSRGIKMPKNPDVIRPRTRKALRRHEYEGYEADAVMKIAREGDSILELGGGIGYISTLIGAHKPVKQIHSFEANPMLIDYIRSAHALNGVENAHVHNALLAPRKGPPRDFYVRQNFLASALDPNTGPEDGIVSVEKVEVRGINTVFKEVKPDVLICDIEGGEADLLPALKYDKLRAAVIELHPQWIGATGVRAVFEAMHEAGLTYYPRWSYRKVVVFRREW
ncbi:FkbM family methyltransferase [Alisedimentitalea sp. MJ-SS2]|uniref:FkbM family methyltransferase n=1 Tax=Aliisedimentitalea sp. MJ-SS2 TaxID=3049795 RepID=UPI002914CC62|nr:FkbM family methyltransferase [Alisedimentitalea sp. MJ-SS2]MDU8926686.1 FkbM family methyltransferase [Alisedimentitalea sp. MJ-SS2]